MFSVFEAFFIWFGVKLNSIIEFFFLIKKMYLRIVIRDGLLKHMVLLERSFVESFFILIMIACI